jgi:hypothetical protein
MKKSDLKRISALIVCSLIIVLGCAEKKEKEEILVSVGDHSISKDEFLQRAELTVRPQNVMDKQQVLNNLVAEKLLVLEFGNRSELLKNENYQLYIQGIQEQDMREQLFMKEAYNKVRVDSSEIMKTFPLAGREYDLAFYSMRDSVIANKIRKMLADSNQTSEEVFDGLGDIEKVPRKKVSYMDSELDIIHKTLYSEPLKRGQVIGPIKIEDNYSIIIKVLGWKEELIIGGGQDFDKRWSNVSKKLKDLKANEAWAEYVGRVMKGKRIDFNRETFNRIVDIFISEYNKKQGIDPNAAVQEGDSSSQQLLNAETELLKKPFFTIDGKVWTVEDFRRLLASHPLVYRNRNFRTRKGYMQQFRYAVADLIRDYYLNKVAYKQKLDKLPIVKRKVEMWKDATLARYHVGQFLKNLSQRKDFDPDLMKGRDNYLSLYIDTLYAKYSDKIVFNEGVYKEIRLTDVPMFAMRQNFPYPVLVPSFPSYTTKNDMGIIIKKEEQ